MTKCCHLDTNERQLSANREEILPRVERAIRMALLRRGAVPSQFTAHVVSNGVLTLLVEGEFQVCRYMVLSFKDRKGGRGGLWCRGMGKVLPFFFR